MIYLIATTWLYIVMMMAVTASHWANGLILFLVVGLAPVALLSWFKLKSHRARMQAQAEAEADTPAE